MLHLGGCCGTCDIGADTFPTDGSGVPTGWTLRTGAFDVVSGFLDSTTSDSLALFSTAHPDGIASAIVTVDVYFGADDEGTIVFNHSGSSDAAYHFVKVTPYEMSLWSRSGSVDTLLKCISCDLTGGPSSVTAYFDGQTTGTFAAVSGAAYVYYNVGTGHTGTYVGLGTKTIAAEMAFDNFDFNKYEQSGNGCASYTPDDCELGADNFNRADDADPGCSWDELAGTGGISSNKYSFTATTSRSRFKIGSDDGAMSVSVKFQGTTAGNTIEVGVGSDTTASAMWYARLAIGLNKDLIIGSIAAGSLATISGTIDTTVDTEYTLTVTLANDRLCASFTDDNGAQFISTAVTVPTTLKYATLGTRTVVSGSVKFDDFVLSEGYDAADHPTCTNCGSSGPTCTDCCPETASEFTVTIAAGLTNKTNCNICARVAGDFVLATTNGECCFKYLDITDDETCDDGATTGVSCASGDTGAQAEVGIYLCYKVDPDTNQCYIAVLFILSVGLVSAGDGFLAFATYLSSGPINPCSGDSITLDLYTGAEDCGHNPYLVVAETPGCNGAWPATITVARTA